MKKLFAVVLFFALCLCSSCQKKPAPAPLSVYLAETDALYVSALREYAAQYPDRELNVETFGDFAEMAVRLESELAAGEGPDVLLFNSLQGGMDTYALAKGGAFRPLEELMGAYPEEAYFTAILDAGKVGGEHSCP